MLALVTCRSARGLDTDLPLLERELPSASIVVWDDPDVDWSAFDTVVVRSTWDYHVRRKQFLTWASAVSEVSSLWNPLSLITWNTDKRYLEQVGEWGVPIVPTTYLSTTDDVERLAAAGGFAGDLIVKPTIGASASGVRFIRRDQTAAIAHARHLLGVGLTPMVQPYVTSVGTHGEVGLVYLGGEYSHAFRRWVTLRAGAGLDAGDVLGDERAEPHIAAAEERAVGDRVVARLPATAYARIDLVVTDDGPLVLEVELAEPSLFLHLDECAPSRAAAVFRNL